MRKLIISTIVATLSFTTVPLFLDASDDIAQFRRAAPRRTTGVYRGPDRNIRRNDDRDFDQERREAQRDRQNFRRPGGFRR